MSRLEKLRQRLDKRFGTEIFERARQDFQAGTMHPGISARLGFVLATLILTTPVLLALGGLWLLWVSEFSILGWIICVLVLSLAYALLPSRARPTGPIYTRDDLPHLFEHLDQIADEMYTSAPSGVEFEADFNGHMAQYGFTKRRFVLGVGFSLWETASPAERTAFLAHEMAHKVNNDPARGTIVGYALQTLQQWYYFVSPPRI